MHFLRTLFASPNDIKLIEENFVIARDKKFHVEIGAFLMACLFDIFLAYFLDLVSKMFIFSFVLL